MGINRNPLSGMTQGFARLRVLRHSSISHCYFGWLTVGLHETLMCQ